MTDETSKAVEVQVYEMPSEALRSANGVAPRVSSRPARPQGNFL